jgi:autotransporter translocation and assembly factor TamB
MRAVFVLVLLSVASCGGDGPTAVDPSTLNGTWSASFTNLSGVGISCHSSSVTTTITTSGNTFTGTYGSGTMTCAAGGQSQSGQFPSGAVVNGTINGNAVAFDLDTPDQHQTGTVSGNSMSGTATWKYNFGAPYGVVTLTGSWSASKQ